MSDALNCYKNDLEISKTNASKKLAGCCPKFELVDKEILACETWINYRHFETQQIRSVNTVNTVNKVPLKENLPLTTLTLRNSNLIYMG